jgi:hypothetical protein
MSSSKPGRAAASPLSRAQAGKLAFISAAVLFLICVASVLNGYYYDDEIGNLRLAASKSYGQIHAYSTVFDVHPAGSYMINKALFGLLRSWPAVKIVGGLLQALADGALILAVAPRMSRRAALILALMLATCSTQVLWGASVRWYAYFTPLYLLAAAALLAQHARWRAELAILSAVSIALFYINYEALVTAPALWLLFLTKRLPHQPRPVVVARLAGAAVAAAAVVAATAPQILVLFSHALNNAGEQFSPIPASVAGALYTITIGNGVFPLSWPAVIGLAGLIVCLAASGRSLASEPLYRQAALILILAGAGLALSGLGGKFRNATPLLPIASILWAGALAQTAGLVGKAAFVAMAVLQLAGVRNVIVHSETAKGSFNKPYGEVLKRLAATRPGCVGQEVLTDDVVLTYLVEQAGYAQSSPFLDNQPTAPILLQPGQCLYVVLSDGGGLAPEDAARLSRFSPAATLRLIESRPIGLDPAARLKRVLDGPGKPYAFDFRLYRADTATLVQRWSSANRPSPTP